jgi:hypothetical protein
MRNRVTDVSGSGKSKVRQVFMRESKSPSGGEWRKEVKGDVGSGILSHTVASAVPSALVGLTTGFGMGPGVPPQL